MVNRRFFVTSGIALATVVAVGPTGHRSRAPSPATAALELTEDAVVLVDRRIEGGAAFAAAARTRGLDTFEFTGDVASVWMREIEPRLRAGPVAIAGYASEPTLFCLDLLARDFGACTVRRVDEGPAVSFVISQRPGRRAALAPAAVRAQWSDSHA